MIKTILISLFAITAQCADVVLGRASDITWVQGEGANKIASFGSAAWTPASLSSIVAWYDAQDYATLTLSNDFVTAWADKSGLGNHATQTTIANRRRYISSDPIANNQPSVAQYDTSGRSCVTTASFTARQFYIVCAYSNGVQSTFPGGYPTLLSGPGVNGVLRAGIGTANSATWFNTSAWATDATTNLASSASSTALPLPLRVVRLDGTSDGTQAWSIGANVTIDGRTWAGPICEVVATSSALSESDRIKLISYLMAKWGIN